MNPTTWFLAVFMLVPTLMSAQTPYIDSLLRVIETTSIDTVRGRTLCRLCVELGSVGQFEEAQTKAAQGLKLVRQKTDRQGEAKCLMSIGMLYHIQGAYDHALAHYTQSLELNQTLGDLKGQAAGLTNMGSLYYDLNDYAQALSCHQRSLAICQQIDDQAGIANSLGNLAAIYSKKGDYAKALEYMELELKIKEKLGLPQAIAATLSNLGTLHSLRGDPTRALDFYQRSRSICEKIGDRTRLAKNLNLIGSIFFEQGNLTQAIDYYQRALAIQQPIGNRSELAGTLNNIGSVYLNQGDWARSLDFFRRSLALYQEIGDRDGMASNLTNMGIAYSEQGNYRRAIELLQRSSAIRQELDDRTELAFNLSSVGINYLKLGQPNTARKYAQEGLSLAQAVGHWVYMCNAAEFLYRIDSARGDWKAAFDALRLFKFYADSLKNDARSREIGRLESKYDYERQAEVERLERENERQRERERFAWTLGSTSGGLLLLTIIAFTLFRSRQKEKKANATLRALNKEIQHQKAEIEAINSELQATLDEISQQKKQIEEQHAKIEDSIRYAWRIQHAILPSAAQLNEALPPHFVHYQPRDIVSGDFYWMSRHENKTLFAAVDCTGHGVPGAFMSVLGSNLLHQIVDENQLTDPSAILAELDRRIVATLRQQLGGDSKDGMDVALVVLHDPDVNGQRIVEFAGAGRPLWVLTQGAIIEYKSAKYACGGSQHTDKTYPVFRFELNRGGRIYLFSDGVTDQFGGPSGRKLGSVGLQQFILSTATLSIQEQGTRFADYLKNWMKSKKQLDDVLLVGIQF